MMNKRKYRIPAVRIIDLTSEGLIASSPESNVSVSSTEETEDNFDWTQKKDGNVWGREGIWK